MDTLKWVTHPYSLNQSLSTNGEKQIRADIREENNSLLTKWNSNRQKITRIVSSYKGDEISLTSGEQRETQNRGVTLPKTVPSSGDCTVWGTQGRRQTNPARCIFPSGSKSREGRSLQSSSGGRISGVAGIPQPHDGSLWSIGCWCCGLGASCGAPPILALLFPLLFPSRACVRGKETLSPSSENSNPSPYGSSLQNSLWNRFWFRVKCSFLGCCCCESANLPERAPLKARKKQKNHEGEPLAWARAWQQEGSACVTLALKRPITCWSCVSCYTAGS